MLRLGPSWDLWGPSWGLFGPSWDPLGAILEPSWGLEDRLGASWGVLGAILRPSSCHLRRVNTQLKNAPKTLYVLRFRALGRPRRGSSWGQVAILRRLGAILEATWRQLPRTCGRVGVLEPSWSQLEGNLVGTRGGPVPVKRGGEG